MAQPATHAKLEELRFKLKTDPKSRLFYQLAEELRKAGHVDESEQVLRSGLLVYPTYLAAWVSLGRTLREQKNDAGAVDALNRALQLDPGNVVAARFLADAYLALGEKVEAIKKYKLVHALLPSDEELRATIERLERDLLPVPLSEPEVAPIDEAAAPVEEPLPFVPPTEIESAAEPFAEFASETPSSDASNLDSPFDQTTPPFAEAEQVLEEEIRVEVETADVEPMMVAHEESPFEEPVAGFSADAFAVEAPMGMHIDAAPLEAEVPLPIFESEEDLPHGTKDNAADTLTMADLYVRQGLVEDARHIYENILSRDPGNAEVRAKLDAVSPRVNPKVAQLERWLAKVSRREVGRV
jgi:tetratricopeptide (TPR) repeat protein